MTWKKEGIESEVETNYEEGIEPEVETYYEEETEPEVETYYEEETEPETEELYEEDVEPQEEASVDSPKKKKGRKILLASVISILCLGLCAIIAAGIYIGVQIVKAPDVDSVDITPDGYLSVIEDCNGEKTQSLYNAESNRIYVPLNATPDYLQKAFVAIEDARFYSHHGIDLKGIARALVKGITSGGKVTEGASTITQQLLKNNVFEGWMEEVTLESRLSRKIQEQYLALMVEKKYSKNWILENYMNTINLGGGTRGVQTASQFYFGKDVSELTLAESALLAGITKNPSSYNPKEHPEKSLERQSLVLDAMEAQGYITAEEKANALQEDVIGHLVYDGGQSANILSWFEDALLVSVVNDLMTQKNMTEEAAWDLIYTGGLTIYSTQNSALQFVCETAVNNPEYVQDTEQISVVVTDVDTGAVAAIVGGRGQKEASLVYNRATDSVCQPGSTIKIIGEYAAALDEGVTTLGSTMEDEPYTYSDGTELHNSYETYGGKTTIRQAISSSCNVIALKMMQTMGIETTAEYLKKFGITTLTEEDYQEALAIGGTYNGITNLELTGAYNAIAAGGQYIRPYYYTKIVDHDGNVILQNTGEKTEAISSDTAKLLTLGMEEVIQSGTGTSVYLEDMELAGKSGTTNDYRDVWFVGFSANYTCGVWGGHDDNTPQISSGYVKDIWRTIMENTPYVTTEYDTKPLVDTSTLVMKTICTKCGKLAIANLCDQTCQGDVTADEYYVPGTEPRGYCDCHIRVTLCQDSSMRCSKYCPSSSKYDCIFLKSAVPGTEDEGCAAEWLSNDTCKVHTSIWNKIFNNTKKNDSSSNGNTGSNSSGNSGNSGDSGSSGNSGSSNGSNNNSSNNQHQEEESEDGGDHDSGNSFSQYIQDLFG